MIDLIIKTNGSERHLSLPIDEQFVPGITEKNSVTTVMVVNEPESLRYLAPPQRNDHRQRNAHRAGTPAEQYENYRNQESRCG